MKTLVFLKGSRRKLKAFPEEARRESGYQLWLVQEGGDPKDWRSMNAVGFGVREIRIHHPHEHRVIYVAQFADAIFVLHAFEKKCQETPQREIEIARKAYAEIEAYRKQK